MSKNQQMARFLLWEFLSFTINASFQRNEIYSSKYISDEKKGEFRKDLKRQLIKISEEYKNSVDEDKHIRNIILLQDISRSKKYKDILKNNEITFGTAQKLLNLFLKYRWIVNEISEPPHCPIDAIVINKLTEEIRHRKIKLKSKLHPSWTTANEQEYKNYIKAINLIKDDMSVTEWELNLWNKKV